MPEPRHDVLHIGEATIHTTTWGSGAPDIVLLHDGLGSVGQWRDVPGDVAERTGRTVVAYDRPGHGPSLPVPSGPWPDNWLTLEAHRLEQLLTALDTDKPLVVGHSDGGTIALLHAVHHGTARAVLALAAHSWVEDAAVDEIRRLVDSSAGVIAGLARHHKHPAEVFEAWSGVWTGAARPFDIRSELHRIDAPVHIVQGSADEFATDAQATATAQAIGPNARCSLLPDAKHLLHHDDPALVIELIVGMG